jgi:hypothetical protein
MCTRAAYCVTYIEQYVRWYYSKAQFQAVLLSAIRVALIEVYFLTIIRSSCSFRALPVVYRFSTQWFVQLPPSCYLCKT